MPNLSHESSIEFWKDFMGGAVLNIIEFIEQTEDWVISNDPKIQEALEKLGSYLDTADNKTNLDHNHLIHICAYIHMSQKLRIMQALDNIQPGLATQLIQTAEKSAKSDKNAHTFLQRNLLFERMRILSRVLAPDRIQTVQKIYES